MGIRYVFILAVAVLYLFPGGSLAAEEEQIELFAVDEPNGAIQEEDVVIPLTPKINEAEIGLRPAGFKQFLEDTAIWYGVQWAGRLWYVRDKNTKIFDASLSLWWDNITTFPEWNDDEWQEISRRSQGIGENNELAFDVVELVRLAG